MIDMNMVEEMLASLTQNRKMIRESVSLMQTNRDLLVKSQRESPNPLFNDEDMIVAVDEVLSGLRKLDTGLSKRIELIEAFKALTEFSAFDFPKEGDVNITPC